MPRITHMHGVHLLEKNMWTLFAIKRPGSWGPDMISWVYLINVTPTLINCCESSTSGCVGGHHGNATNYCIVIKHTVGSQHKLAFPSMEIHYTVFCACIRIMAKHKLVFPSVEIPYTVLCAWDLGSVTTEAYLNFVNPNMLNWTHLLKQHPLF